MILLVLKSFVFFAFVSIPLQGIQLTEAQLQSVECIESIYEANDLGWYGSPYAALSADISDELPGDLKGQLEGRGIIYFEGDGWSSHNLAAFVQDIQPSYLYVKYYGHFNLSLADRRPMQVFPTTAADLEPTSNFEWGEALLHLDGNLDQSRVGVQLLNFDNGEYFLLEKVILSQGYLIETMDDIKNLCPPREDVRIECFDVIEDYDKYHWDVIDAQLGYSESSEDLPGSLAGQLEGDGIFYFEGGLAWSQAILRYPNYISPLFLYIKYYGHTAGISPSMSVYPVEGEGNVGIPRTSNFEWGEVFFELSSGALNYGIRLSTIDFVKGDYFLIEKIVLVQGLRNITDMEQVKTFCSSDEEEPTSTSTSTTTTTTTTTTDSPPDSTPGGGEFECVAEGNFADPSNCSIFHKCQLTDSGEYLDTVFTCPGVTVWCQKEDRCETPVICPCSINSIWTV